MRKISIVTGEYYHVFNRGVEKRDIFLDRADIDRFMDGLVMFNQEERIGSLYEYQFIPPEKRKKSDPLVEIIAYNLLSNHFHLVVRQLKDRGISEFLKRLSGGYSNYFNLKYKRSGSLFQGPYKATHIDTNEYLLYVSAYVNLNHMQNSELGYQVPKSGVGLVQGSWEEYISKSNYSICSGINIVLEQFNESKSYKDFALEVLESVRQNKEKYKELKNLEY